MTSINPNTEARIYAYHKYLVLRNFQPSTTTMYCRAVRKYYEFCDQSFQGTPITQDLTQEYLLTRVQAGKSWSTINYHQCRILYVTQILQSDFELSVKSH